MNQSVSIILPTYNRATSLPEIVNALLNQSYQDFELIIVNDGSKDDTAEVLERLAQSDSRIKAVNKPNGGVSTARNAGIEAATGEFVIFVDDDDNVGPDYIKNLMDVDQDVDLVIDSYSHQTDDGPKIQKNFPEIKIEGYDIILNALFGEMQRYPYCFFPIAKRYKREILKNYNIRFCKEITLGEDRPFILDYLRYANSLEIINTHSYIVRAVTDTNYRLSQGVKPADYLIRNFRDSYNFLVNYGKEHNNGLILRYADNYLAEKVIDYLLIPMASKKFSSELGAPIVKDVPELWHNIKLANVKSIRNRLIVRAVRYLGVKSCVSAMKLVKR